MNYVEPILSIASQIYTLVETVKANRKRCRRVSERVGALEGLVRSIEQRGQAQTSDDVKRALKGLCITLTSAEVLIKKFAQAKWVKRILKSSSHGDEFNSVNERLNDAFQVLSGALQVEQGDTLFKVFELTTREREDKADGKEDDMELKRLLIEHMESQQREFEELKINVQNLLKIMDKPSVTNEDIREIKPNELKYEHPKEPFMTTSTSEVYRGEYRGFQVAIKRYTDLVNASLSEVQSVFKKEVDTMKRFESPNILRMFGICVQEEGPSPQFLIIMEYCEKGSLRQVLDSERGKLSWTRKARMCLDAAKGLYRLHQTEEKSKVHGCINSFKFLVTEGYTVKLGGFELAKTETSLKKSTKKSAKDQEIRSLCYSSPEALESINHVYNKECEMYSFGIVLWEIATCKRPFEGCANEDIYERVCEEKYQEPLPDDCPKPLGDLINTCRAYKSFHRPSAGVLVDQLRSVVAKLEE
ncbi:mixed lineage kinase domain-like protein [Pagrus major]|uniref:mixed lineage kinase domain-like protein n=1 Tax=Pagrus major TaxID=143350 RepID=UPI003CC86BC8